MKVDILGCLVDRIDMDGALKKIEEFIQSGKPHHIITLNAEIIHKAQSDPRLKEIIKEADLVTPDGSGVVWASNYLNAPVPERVTGIDLTLKLAEIAAKKGWTFYFYGGAPTVAETAAENLQKRYNGLKIVGTCHGYISETDKEKLLKDIKEKKPDILLVALGAPRQEFWIKDHQKELQVPVSIGIGGSLDVISGKAKRAPIFFQKAGLEWLYRLIKEPHRIGRMTSLPKFSIQVRLKGKKH
ncbi:MAG: N-acetylmannosaminyltransferase [Desulfitibacter sp. BRH_c19]|nr:MAG: N-acetylmannosaminyltransferase [Desulfitibacter sp. BRH_c19]